MAREVVQDGNADQEGITEGQLTQLRSRKRGLEVESEPDKWIRIYKILFPEGYLTPSPCECPDKRRTYHSLAAWANPSDQEGRRAELALPDFQSTGMGEDHNSFLGSLRAHTEREAARLIRPKLEDFLDGTTRENLTPQSLEGLFRDVFTKVLDTFPTTQSKAQTKSKAGDAQSVDRAPAPTTTQTSQEPSAPISVRHPQIHLPGSESLHNPSSNLEVPHQASTSAPPSFEWSSYGAYGVCDPDSLLQLGVHTEAGPSTTQRVVMDYGFPPSRYPTTDMLRLTDLFPFEDFHDESTARLGQPDETSSDADSGSYSSKLGGGESSEIGKGKESGWDLFEGV